MKKVDIVDKKAASLQEFKENKYGEVQSLIKKRHTGLSSKNFLTFLSIVFDSFLDYRFVKGIEAEDLYQLILNYYRFFMKEISPIDSRFPKLPMVSIEIFNPSDGPDYKEAAKHQGAEITVIQIHTIDGPFIFESIWNYLKKKGLHIFNAIHPVIPVFREGANIVEISDVQEKGEREVFINIYVEKIVNPQNRKKVEFEILSVLRALFLAISDFEKMLGVTERLMKERKEQADFLKWLKSENFIFMGIQKYDIKKKGKKNILVPDDLVKFGVFRDMPLMETIFPGQIAEVEQRSQNSFDQGDSIVLDFFNTCSSTIYHFDPIDCIGIDGFNNKGERTSKTVLFGRFARGAMFQKSTNIPILSGKVKKLLGTAKKKYSSSHYRREFFSIFNQLPKRELFYLNLYELHDLVELIASVQSDEKASVFVKNDPQGCYLSLFIIISRSKYSREVRQRIKGLLKEKFRLPITRWETSDCLPNTVLTFYLDTRHAKKVFLDVDSLETEIQAIITTWQDRLIRHLVQEHGDRNGFALYNRYRNAFSGLYKEITDVWHAMSDIQYLEKLEKHKRLCINIFSSNPEEVEIRIYSYVEIDLMTIIPTANNLGLYVNSEQVLPLRTHKGDLVYIHIFKISGEEAFLKNLLDKSWLISEMLIRIMDGGTVNDQLNHLVLKTGFNWKAVELFRTVKSYLLQIDNTFSPNSIDEVLIKFPDITRILCSYFETKFKPKTRETSLKKRKKELSVREGEFLDSLSQISSLMEDQIFRGVYDIFKNMLRTNFYKSPDTNYISFKIDCLSIIKMPSPRPFYEVYVHSPELEAVHLRGGKVARGGLRWSDRYDDFRMEILGLMKTQMVKNSVIVPVGSKGGFVLRKREFKKPKERESYLKKQYQIFISGLLDITDNIESGKPVPALKVVAYDGHDPYLVVAADKGTAKLSDAANEVSEKYRFWLGDAFASGGTVGYDHKKEGITARGAWECVKRHFREQGIDIQEESIRVAGIGDMAGDVFGNGMLLSQKIQLVAAFNHVHIFLDPDPDPLKSWKERKRLFENPRLTWIDYSKKIIGKGGEIYSRKSKSITLSTEAKKMLGIEKERVNGEELIRSILAMKVDLLWNGGIGTYVKSSSESHLDVGDRSNDSVRVDAKDLRAKVLGEGGNLGITQLGRIEAGKKGVICNTDAIDNSGGVDMSDHEVNLKILLGTLLESGEVKSKEERDELFSRVTDEVAKLVLKDNYLQSAAISMDRIMSSKKIEPFLDTIDHLVELKILNRKEEFVPTRENLLEEKGKNRGILRPVLAVPLGYSKMYVYQKILHSKLVETVFVEYYLNQYFPEVFHREFPSFIKDHRLKKEIISTVITNKIINQAGSTYFYIMEEKTGREPWEIARAYIIIENMLNADDFRSSVYNLDNRASSDLQYQMLINLEHVIFHLTEWMLLNLPEERINFDLISHYQGVVENFKKNLVENLESICSLGKDSLDKELKKLKSKNIPRALAEAYTILPYLKDIMAILRIKEELHYDFTDTGNLYIKLNHYLFLDWLEESLEEVDSSDEWEEEAGENLYEELKDYQDRIVVNILNFKRCEESMSTCFNNYMKERKKAYAAYKDRVEKIKEDGKTGLISFSVLVRSLRGFL